MNEDGARHQDALEIGQGVPLVTLRQFTYFLAAARHQSVMKAAEALNVSSPSVSTAISQLEEILGQRLFERRHARGLLLTPAGVDLAGHVRSVLLHVREIESSAQRGVTRDAIRINVGCLNTLAPYVLPAMFQREAELPPNVQIGWREDNHERLLKALHNGVVDFVIVYDYDLPSTLQLTEIRPMPVQVVLPKGHALASRPSVRLADVAPEPMVLLDQEHTRDYFLSLFSNEGLEPKIRYRAATFDSVRSLVANGIGYSLLNFSPPYHAEGHGSLVSRPLETGRTQQSLVMARLYRYRSPPFSKELVGLVREVVDALTITC